MLLGNRHDYLSHHKQLQQAIGLLDRVSTNLVSSCLSVAVCGVARLALARQPKFRSQFSCSPLRYILIMFKRVLLKRSTCLLHLGLPIEVCAFLISNSQHNSLNTKLSKFRPSSECRVRGVPNLLIISFKSIVAHLLAL